MVGGFEKRVRREWVVDRRAVRAGKGVGGENRGGEQT
jgi:hypothetical protein